METKNFWGRLCPKLPRVYIHTMAAVLLCAALATTRAKPVHRPPPNRRGGNSHG